MKRIIKRCQVGKKENEWFTEPCRDPSHEFPGMLVLPPEGYTHTCPTCGKKTLENHQEFIYRRT